MKNIKRIMYYTMNSWNRSKSLTVTSKDEKAVIKYTNGNYKTIHIQEYNYTDLPAGEYKLFITDGVLMLPSEY